MALLFFETDNKPIKTPLSAEMDRLSDHTKMFKQFCNNPSFKNWLSDSVFGVTYQA